MSALIKKPTKAYWFCQLTGWGSMLIMTSLFLLPVLKDLATFFEYIERGLYTASGGLIISHFVIRGTAHIMMRRHGWHQVKFWLLAILAVFAAVASVLWLEIVVHGFLATPIDSVSFEQQANTGKHGSGFTFDMSGVKGIFSTYLSHCGLFLLWSICYYVITGRREKKRLQQALKEQQLAGLLNQINPHFLFNSLNTIRGMIYQDRDKAAEVVTQLSELFRYNLSTDLRTHVALKDEWHICCQYLEIESVRFGKRLTYSMHCPKELENVTLPSMSILTLVENAVKHGISHLPSGGEVGVEVAYGQLHNSVEVIVKNPFDVSRVSSGTQLGLKNIRSRLAIMFDGQGKLLVEPSDNEYVVRMVIPNGK